MSKKFAPGKKPQIRLPRPTRVGLVVLGMHRSGTSALTGAMGLIGASMPADLMEGNAQNIKGFFESNSITGLNDDLLASAGQSWSTLSRFPQAWYNSPDHDLFMSSALTAIESDFGWSPLFALKDPRICRLVPFWDEALRRFGSMPLYVVTWRHPLDVTASLTLRGNYAPDYGLAMWLRHVLDAEADSRGKPRVVTSYEAVLEDWRREMSRIADGLNLIWPRSLAEAGDEVDAFLSRDLQNFSLKADSNRERTLPDWHTEVTKILSRWTLNGEDAQDHGRLDYIRAAFNAAEMTLSDALNASQSAYKAAYEANIWLSATTDERDRYRETAKTLEAERDTLLKAQETVAAEMTALQGAHAAAVSTLSDERDRYRETAETLGAERDTLRSTLAQRAQELEDIYRQHADERAELVSARARLEKLERLRRRDRVHMDDLVSHLSNAVPTDQVTEIRNGLMAELSRVQAKAEAAEAERQREHAALQAMSRQAEDQRRDLVAEAEALRTAYESSRSWKATAFLRRIRRGLRSR